jgi:glycosyltransferase involved in cell wall biosynthesis
VARYIEGLLGGLDELGVAIDVVAKPGDVSRLRENAPGHRYHASPAAVAKRPIRFAWEQFGLPRLARRLGADVIHSPHYTFPLGARARSVVTVHDATFFTDPAAHSRVKRTFFTWWTRRAGRSASALVAPSQATADAVRSRVRVTHLGPVVAYLGVDAERFHRPTADEVADFAIGHELGDGWIAFLGTIEPRKNVANLVRAYLELRRTRTDHGLTTPQLAISGSRGWDAEAAAVLDASSPRDGVTELGYLPVDELRSLLGGSAVVVYPSLGEGFGLPVLEAMACGSAVLTTRRLSIPEVGGNAVSYTEPDAASLRLALGALLDDGAERARLAATAVERAAAFTWRRCAEQHLPAYHAAAEAR